MDMSFEDLVREHAYHLWLASGRADGHEHEHWAMAEQAVKADIEPLVILTEAAKPAAKPIAERTPKSTPKSTLKSTGAKAAAKPAAKTAKPATKKVKAEVAASL